MFRRYRFSLILLLIGLCICLIFNPFTQITSNPLIINPNSPYKLIGRLYRPLKSDKPLPVVILAHGINSSKEMMTPLAIELARNNIAGLAFDFAGFGESHPLEKNQQSVDDLTQSTIKDTQAILNYLQHNPQQFNLDKIAIVGHSMGGVTALEFAKKNLQIKSTVTLGIGGEATATSPANLLFNIGTYEQLNPAHTLKPLLKTATKDCLKQQMCDNFAAGTARKLKISPTTDHINVIFDSIIIQETIDWIKHSLQLTTPTLTPVMPEFIIGILLGGTGLIFGLTLFLVTHTQLIRWRSLTIAFAFLMILAQFNLLSPFIISHTLLILLIVSLLSNYAQVRPHNWSFNLSLLAIYIFILFTAVWLATFLHGLEELIKEPTMSVYLPLFALKWVFYVVYNRFLELKSWMFPQYTFAVTVNPIFLIILILDSFKLGIVLTTIVKVTMIIVDWLRQPFRLGIKNLTTKEVIILGILGIICLIVLWLRYSQGLLNDAISQWEVVSKLFILFIFVPIIIIIVALRSPFLKHIETHLKERFNN